MRSGWMHTNNGEDQEKFAPNTLAANVFMSEGGQTLLAALANYLLASSYTAADVLAKLLTVDGAGSGLDADKFKGNATIPIANGGTGSTSEVGARSALGLRIQIFTNPSQFGVTVTSTTTLQAVFSAMPDVSMLIYSPPTTLTSDLSPSATRYGTLRITKMDMSRPIVEYFPKTTSTIYRNYIYSDDGGSTYTTGSWAANT